MEYLGVVIELKNNKAFIMTDSCEVVCIRKQPGMYEGMEVTFEKSEKINKANSAVKYSAVIGSVAAVFIAVMFYINLFYSNQIYAYVDIDLNTNWELMVNKENKVIDIKSKDKSSKLLIEELDFKSKPLENVLVDMVEKLNQNGMIDLNTDNIVLITTCFKAKDGSQVYENELKNLKSSYSKIRDELLSRNIEPYFMELKSEDRKLAIDNNISMSRYSIYKIVKEQRIDIDIEKLKQNEISEILEKVVIDSELICVDNSSSDKVTDQNPKVTDQNPKVTDQDPKVTDQDPKVTDQDPTVGEKDNNVSEQSGNEFYRSEDIDLSVGGIDDIDNIKSIEAANVETQKVIQRIQMQVNTDIAFETDNANKEIYKIKLDTNISSEQKDKQIKQIKLDLTKKIDEIKKIGNDKAQEELTKLEKKAQDLLPQIN